MKFFEALFATLLFMTSEHNCGSLVLYRLHAVDSSNLNIIQESITLVHMGENKRYIFIFSMKNYL